MQIAVVNDRMVRFEEVDSQCLDRGLFFGDGVYEVLRSYNGRIFAMDEHFERFANSLKAIEIAGVDVGAIRSQVLAAFDKAAIANARIYFHVTRGSEARDHLPSAGLKPNFFLTVTEIKDNPALKEAGVAVSTYPDIRWKRCDIKSLNLLPSVMAKRDAAGKGCWEAVFVNDRGRITEGGSSAFFGVVKGRLRTSPLNADILPSVTRIYAKLAAKNIGLAVVEKSMTPREAAAAEELFLAVTTTDIVPVVRFDGRQIADGKPGKWTKQIVEEFRKSAA